MDDANDTQTQQIVLEDIKAFTKDKNGIVWMGYHTITSYSIINTGNRGLQELSFGI